MIWQIWRPVFSEFSLLMALFTFTVYTVVCCFLSKKAGWNTLWAIGFGVCLTVVRCLLPFEMPGAHIIRTGLLLSEFFAWWSAPFWKWISLRSLLLMIWGSGSLALLLRLGSLLFQQQRMVQGSKVSKEDRLCRQYLRTLGELGCSKVGTVSRSPAFQTAMMAGFFRPNVLLPDYFQNLCNEELNLIFRHEIMHYLSRDLWIKLFMEILRCLLWWNPAAHYLCSSVGQLLEMRCDSRVCAGLSPEEQVAYLEALLNTFRKSPHLSAYLVAGYGGYSSRERMKQRFRQVAHSAKRRKHKWLPVLIAVTSVCLFIGSYAVIFQTGDRSEEMSSEGAFILQKADGKLVVFIENQLYGTITDEQLAKEPFCSMPIYKGIST